MNNPLLPIVKELSMGVPGALALLSKIMIDHPKDLPVVVMTLTRKRIAGSAIWALYKDKFKEDFDVFLNYLKTAQ